MLCLQALMMHAWGGHTPVNPHRQRLLVACNKAAKIPKVPGAKAKPKNPAPAMDPVQQPKDPKPAAPKKPKQAEAKAAPAKSKNPASETEYMVEKNRFLATLLGLKCAITTTC